MREHFSSQTRCARAKCGVVTRLCAEAQIVAVQELHGSHDEARLAAQRMRTTHAGFHSVAPTPTAGGVALWVAHAWLDGGDVWSHSIADGRLLIFSAG